MPDAVYRIWCQLYDKFTMWFQSRFKSLRLRFIVMTGAVTLLILITAFYSILELNQTRSISEANLIQRQKVLVVTKQIRLLLSHMYKSMDLFLLEPSEEKYKNAMTDNYDRVLKEIQSLYTLDVSRKSKLDEVSDKLSGLGNQLEVLIQTRRDPAKQYPSMNVGSEVMQPNRNKVNNAFGIAIEELESENTLTKNPEVYQSITEARHLWGQLLSNFRLYLANRVGSFNVDSLSVQENGIDTLFTELNVRLEKILELDEQGLLGFETADAMSEAKLGTTAWYNGFRHAREINRSNRWRMDSVIIQTEIAPRFEQINDLVDEIEKQHSASLEEDIDNISVIAEQSNWKLLFLALMSVVFMFLVVLLTQKLVFTPIVSVSRAMRAQAMGKSTQDLPPGRTTETRGLIDAFNEMYRQINVRQSELEYRAMHDALTSLPNRTLLFDHIQHDIQLAQRLNQQVCLMMIDLDRFKEVNDTLGHAVGDMFLVEVGKRLLSVLRETDTVARLGGDEFSVLLPNMGEVEAKDVAGKILAALNEPVKIERYELPCSASIGITSYPKDGQDAKTLLQHSDVAMYMAKRRKTGYAIYDKDKDLYSLKRLELVNELREAIDKDMLSLVFQPIVNMQDKSLLYVETLLRWEHPVHGAISPDQIIDMAEQTNLIAPLTYYILEKSLQQRKKWQQHDKAIQISVNLSMHNLRDKDLVDKIKTILHKNQLSGEGLLLEITESAMMSNPGQVIDVLAELEDLNIQVAVDDFGTGFSSLSYLKKLPVHVLKIDRSFIYDLERDLNDQAIVRATLRLGHDLGLKVIAEGVETREVQNFLQKEGCDAIQGYYISPPVTAASLGAWHGKNYH